MPTQCNPIISKITCDLVSEIPRATSTEQCKQELGEDEMLNVNDKHRDLTKIQSQGVKTASELRGYEF
jgi:hypothetical protein